MNTSLSIPVTESSQVGEARRRAHGLAQQAGLGEAALGTLGIIVTELGTNLYKHAARGEIVIRRLGSASAEDADGGGIEVLSVDRGPGMGEVARCMADGFSTTGTTGNGLGSIRRLSSVFDLHSCAQGTVIVSQLWGKGRPDAPRRRLEVGAVCLPCAGETASGDAWTSTNAGALQTLLVADGLGHGVYAAEAADQAVALFEESQAEGSQSGESPSPQFLLRRLHGGLRSTRGAAVLILQADLRVGKINCCGIGNVSASVVIGSASRSVVSLNGTVGHVASRFQEFFYEWDKAGLLVMHTDGLQTKWKLDSYPGLQMRHPSVVAGVLYRDFTRGRDDVTVLVAREI